MPGSWNQDDELEDDGIVLAIKVLGGGEIIVGGLEGLDHTLGDP